MQRTFSLLCLGAGIGVAVLFGIFKNHVAKPTATLPINLSSVVASSVRTTASYAHLPISFERNEGQVDKRVQFVSHSRGFNLFLTANEAVLALRGKGVAGSRNTDGYRGHRTNHEPQTTTNASRTNNQQPATSNHEAVLWLKLLGANSHPEIDGQERLPGSVNYFIGNDPSKWRTGAPTYGRVSYKSVYPGIDMVFYGNQQQLEYDWVVKPGADLHRIGIGIQGAEKATLTPEGDLNLTTPAGSVVQHAPVAYQEVNGIRRSVASRLVLNPPSPLTRNRRIGFEVGAYDPKLPLIIDPVLAYSTYLGGSNGDYSTAIAVDSVGNAYVTGYAASMDFPTELPYDSTLSTQGLSNAFVSKINASGTALLYSSYLGGTGTDQGNGIAVDSSGNAYVAGKTTSTNFPTLNAYQSTNHAGGSATSFVTKFNATGTALVYSTYLGGSTGDVAHAIAVDSSGNAYITGQATSTNFPVTSGCYQSTNRSSSFGTAFITKLNAAGSTLSYSTYLGGSESESSQGIAVDGSGNAYITGYTASTDFPVANAYQSTKPSGSGIACVFVTKMNAVGNSLFYSTYLGGSGADDGEAIAVDSSGYAYVTGSASSNNFPVQLPIQATLHGANNAFITKFKDTGSSLVYSTYLGGSATDAGYGIGTDVSGNAYVTGISESGDFPMMHPIQAVNATDNASSVFVAKISSTGGSLIYSTYLGGSIGDQGTGIAVDSLGTAYVTGQSLSYDFPLQNPFQGINRTGQHYNAFIARVGPNNWQIADTGVGADGKTRLLWNIQNTEFTTWSVDSGGVVTYGEITTPGSTWTAESLATGSDGITRVLANSANDTAALWEANSGNTTLGSVTLGPYTGWRAVDVTVGSDNKSRLLWSKSDGTAGVWTVDSAGNLSNLTNLGPYAGWTVTRIAAGSDGFTRLLWAKNDGTVGVWLLNANNTYKSGFNFGPSPGWRAIDLTVGSDNKARLLWNRSDGTAGIWTVDNSGSISNMVNFGPFSGWTASKLAGGVDGLTRLCWYKGDGTVGLWLLNANNSQNSFFSFGPY